MLPSGVRNQRTDLLFKSGANLPPAFPGWLWTVLVCILGIRESPGQNRFWIATLLYILTLTSAFVFGASGFFFNVTDAASDLTQTTTLICVVQSVLGLYWIMLGIYANLLAVRLFSNKRMVDCIHLPSKTFLKMNTAIIIIFLSVCVVSINLHTNRDMLQEQLPDNETLHKEATCVSLGLEMFLCQVLIGSKLVFSCFCLTWNLLVSGMYLSICRTHTMSIRNFMKELMYDSQIYLEFCKIRESMRHVEMAESVWDGKRHLVTELEQPIEANVWDDDIMETIDSASDTELSVGAQLLESLRNLSSTMIMLDTDKGQGKHISEILTAGLTRQDVLNNLKVSDKKETENSAAVASHENQETVTSQDNQDTRTHQDRTPEEKEIIKTPSLDSISPLPLQSSPPSQSKRQIQQMVSDGQNMTNLNSPYTDSPTLNELEPPLISNEELLYTYFQLLRRLSSTSRLLQRWLASWITFVLLWCALLIVYWTNHTAHVSGVSQFLIPLVVLGLLTSSYAEVNFQGQRLVKSILPTEDRMSLFFYFQSCKLELKIFSFTLTYNTLVTVVAGVALTFLTRIIIDEFSLDTNHYR